MTWSCKSNCINIFKMVGLSNKDDIAIWPEKVDYFIKVVGE